MGQRFQVLIQIDKKLYCYHAQWLWGEYAIRRLGSVVYALQKKSKTKYFNADREIYTCLQWGFIHRLEDQNTIHPYFDLELLGQEELKGYAKIQDFLETLDNNNGQFLLKIKDDKVVGYAFYNPSKYNEASEERQGKLIDWKEYLKDYTNEELLSKFDKTQVKEFERGKKVFENLEVLKSFPDIDIE